MQARYLTQGFIPPSPVGNGPPHLRWAPSRRLAHPSGSFSVRPIDLGSGCRITGAFVIVSIQTPSWSWVHRRLHDREYTDGVSLARAVLQLELKAARVCQIELLGIQVGRGRFCARHRLFGGEVVRTWVGVPSLSSLLPKNQPRGGRAQTQVSTGPAASLWTGRLAAQARAVYFTFQE